MSDPKITALEASSLLDTLHGSQRLAEAQRLAAARDDLEQHKRARSGSRRWRNWSRNRSAANVTILTPTDEETLVRAVQQAAEGGRHIKPLGRGYSCSSVGQPDDGGVAIDTSELSDILHIDQDKSTVKVQAGIQLQALCEALADHKLALENLGGFTGQSLAGVLSTSTHGTGLAYGPFCDAVLEIELVVVDACGRAQIRRLKRGQNLFKAAVVSLGAMGVLYSVTLELVPLYFVRETHHLITEQADWDAFDTLIGQRAVAGFVHPTKKANGVRQGMYTVYDRIPLGHADVPTTWLPEPPKERFAAALAKLLGTRHLGWLANLHPDLTRTQLWNWMKTQVEQSKNAPYRVYFQTFPEGTADNFRAVFAELAVDRNNLHDTIETLLSSKAGKKLLAPLSIGFVRASEQLLSMFHGGDKATIEMFALRGSGGGKHLQTLVELAGTTARPHWGMLNAYQDEDKNRPCMKAYYDGWPAWKQARAKLDPTGTFHAPIHDQLNLQSGPFLTPPTMALVPRTLKKKPASLRVLCLHGIGLHDQDTRWRKEWTDAIEHQLAPLNAPIEVSFLLYDSVFRAADLDLAVVAEATARLLASGLYYGLGSALGLRKRARGGGIAEKARWTAGMVAQWTADEKLRKTLRQLLLTKLKNVDLVLAHSLGSLIAYDCAIAHGRAWKNITLATFGSQIGNPFVRGTFAGKLPMPKVRFWYNLHNPNDKMFTTPLQMPAGCAFEPILTEFDVKGVLEHDPIGYLTHENAVLRLWHPLNGTLPKARQVFRRLRRPSNQRVLLVGIDDYPDEAQKLAGCVNDVYLISATLQESGVDPENIRVLLNQNATADGMRRALAWLLEDVRGGDERMFYFSGHGTQLPVVEASIEEDRLDEVLVPWDFDWTRETGITDDDFMHLYAQLPYDAHFLAVFDCCHAGGIARAGGPKVRGLDLPDDLRHRSLRWNAAAQMWVPRTAQVDGTRRGLRAVGTGKPMRRTNFDSVRKKLHHLGPYKPLILQACGENELSYEYVHGVTSYGAFTYALTTTLRQMRLRGQQPSFTTLVEQVGTQLQQIGYGQTPQLEGPRAWRDSTVRWGQATTQPIDARRARVAELLQGDFETHPDAEERIEELYQALEEDPSLLPDAGPTARRADQAGSMQDTVQKRWGMSWASVHKPRSLQDLLDLLRKAKADRSRIRLAGAARSLSLVTTPLGAASGQVRLVSLLKLSSDVPFREDRTAWQRLPRTPRFQVHAGEVDRLYRCEAGRSVKKVLQDVRDSGRSLTNHGSGWFQGIAAAIATGTHGSSHTIPPMSSVVRSLTIVVFNTSGNPEVQLLMPSDSRRPFHPDGSWVRGPGGVAIRVVVDTARFDAAVVGLGCQGLIYALTIELLPTKLYLREVRELTTWNALNKDFDTLVRFAGDRHLEVQICPHAGHGQVDGKAVRRHDHLVQLVRREETNKPLISGNPHWMILAGRLPAASGIIGRRIRRALEDPRRLPDSIVTSLTQLSRHRWRGYIADVLMLNLKYEGLGAEYAVPMEHAQAAANYLLGIARKHDQFAEQAFKKGPKALRTLWRTTPPFTAVLTMRFSAPESALLSMTRGIPGEPMCIFEVGMLGSPGLNKAVRNQQGETEVHRRYRAYLEGRKRLFNTLERQLVRRFDARPHWGLYNRLDPARANTQWPTWQTWRDHAAKQNRFGVFDSRLTDRLELTQGPPRPAPGQVLVIDQGARTRVLFYGDLAWALYQRLPNKGITRVATHIKGTEASWCPVVCEVVFDGRTPAPASRGPLEEHWWSDGTQGSATWDPNSRTMELGRMAAVLGHALGGAPVDRLHIADDGKVTLIAPSV